LIEAKDLMALMESFNSQDLDLRVVTAVVKNPGSLGRVIRRGGQLMAIVEAKDASSETLKVKEINTGIYLIKAKVLNHLLPLITDNNAQKEFYLTDLIHLAQEQRLKLDGYQASPRLAFGVNTQVELSVATRALFLATAKKWMEAGVLILDPRNTYIEETVSLSSGSVIYPMVTLRGKTRVGTLSAIETGCFIVDSEIGDQVEVKAYSHIERSRLEKGSSVGPYARLRPEVVIGEGAHIGNFVELKKVKFGAGSKAGHLTYLGDAEIGKNVNIGCGTITCNYAVDRKKYKTLIGDGVFVGSDTQFVAPVKIGNHAVIGSGSTITKDVPERALAVARGRQFVKENYVSAPSETPQPASPKSDTEKM
jgi:bifunctional UDP-N-acetylglucosamine pyrophosphorylase/glucosamine-1-phosphate N-acetyltransferase